MLSKSTIVIINHSCFYLAILNMAHVCSTYAMCNDATDITVILPACIAVIIYIKIAIKYVSSSTKYSTKINVCNVCRGRDSFIGMITLSIWGKQIITRNPNELLIIKTEASELCHVFDLV